eukprot:COSAG06_NODE_939_length_11389_cov_2.472016_3_plen_58_part_00
MGARDNVAGASSSSQQGHASPYTVSYPTTNPVVAASFSADPEQLNRPEASAFNKTIA